MENDYDIIDVSEYGDLVKKEIKVYRTPETPMGYVAFSSRFNAYLDRYGGFTDVFNNAAVFHDDVDARVWLIQVDVKTNYTLSALDPRIDIRPVDGFGLFLDGDRE